MDNSGTYNAGDRIDYIITVSNTGNTTVNNVVVDDVLVGLHQVVGTMIPGQIETINISYTLTQSDIDNGSVSNQATVTYDDINGTTYTNDSDDPTDNTDADDNDTEPNNDPDDPTVINLPVHHEIVITKTGVLNYSGTYPMPGDRIDYTFEVSNAGNTTLSGVSIEDQILENANVNITYVSGDVNGDGNLNVGEIWIYTASYQLTQTDIDAGHFDNQATVHATDIHNNPLEDLSDDPDNDEDVDTEGDGEPDDITVTNIPQHAELTLEKTGEFIDANHNGMADVGETIVYRFKVTNIGNVSISNISISDPIVNVTGGPLASLAPGESDSTTFTALYIITREDIDAGEVVNTAVVSGDAPNGIVSIYDDSDDPDNDENIDPDGDGEPDDPTIVETLGVIIPTIFTPNGNGTNDYFEIIGIRHFKDNSIKIYNRWGNLVYEKEHYGSSDDDWWYGTSNVKWTIGGDKGLPAATYYYVLDLGNGIKPQTGYIYLDK